MLFKTPPINLAPDFWLLKGFALGLPLRLAIDAVARAAPFRHFKVAGGKQMAVAMTNCGALGWTSSEHGYRYTAHDPDSGLPWPALPALFTELAADAAAQAGFAACPWNACLVNRYAPGSGMGLHQDKDELDLSAPIVSVSIGAPCKFMVGGLARSSGVQSVALADGDVMVWGGQSRLIFHGVRPLPKELGGARYNLTFRKAD
jgi:DNA oxidative demethylase